MDLGPESSDAGPAGARERREEKHRGVLIFSVPAQVEKSPSVDEGDSNLWSQKLPQKEHKLAFYGGGLVAFVRGSPPPYMRRPGWSGSTREMIERRRREESESEYSLVGIYSSPISNKMVRVLKRRKLAVCCVGRRSPKKGVLLQPQATGRFQTSDHSFDTPWVSFPWVS